ncbi:hypothetical protein ACFSKW_26895 [Nonomuraea mangrovi]|uniref:ATP-grasp domain-containing protein n=1 Tax=Nonomuraea mangrovi TaxID=2316207 RepID=A0ABW4T199_9ACTN
MTGLGSPDPSLVEAADRALRAALGGRPLVSVERFACSGRTAYAGSHPVPSARPALAIACYAGWEAASPEASLAEEASTRVRGPAERHAWLNVVDSAARELMSTLSTPPVIATWYSTSRLREWTGPRGTIAAVDGGLRRQLEDKADFDDLLRAAGVPARLRIRSIRVTGRLPALAELRRKLGTNRLVVQCGAESGGRGTVFVDTDTDLAQAAQMLGPYKVAAFIPGWSSNTTALSIPDGSGGVAVYVDRPSHKAVGVGEAGIGSGKSAGNDWSRPWPEQAAADLIAAAVQVGVWAWRTHRYAGLFGLDAILTAEGSVKLNEINCRKQGTTEVSGVNQQLRGLPPFVTAHLTALLGGQVDWLPPAEEFNADTVTTATQTQPGPFYLKLRNRGTEPVTVTNLNGPGIYRLVEGSLIWTKPGAHPAQADADRGELLLANLPTADVRCLPGAELGTAEAITAGACRPFDGPHSLSAFGRAVLDAVGRRLHSVPAPTLER